MDADTTFAFFCSDQTGAQLFFGSDAQVDQDQCVPATLVVSDTPACPN